MCRTRKSSFLIKFILEHITVDGFHMEIDMCGSAVNFHGFPLIDGNDMESYQPNKLIT